MTLTILNSNNNDNIKNLILIYYYMLFIKYYNINNFKKHQNCFHQ